MQKMGQCLARIIAVVNQKGGVGKTTTAINTAASLAAAEKKTLLVDFDPQGNATSGLGLTDNILPNKTVYQSLVGQCFLKATVLPTELPGLYVAPANCHLSGAEIELVREAEREKKLKNILEPLRKDFDYILLDCPPSLGLLTVNALTAADSYLVPLQSEYFALEGFSQLQSTVSLIRNSLNPGLRQEGILLTMVDYRNNLSKQVCQEVCDHFKVSVFQTMVPRNVRLGEAPSHGKPILLYDIESKGAVAYLSLAREIIQRESRESKKFVEVEGMPMEPAQPETVRA